MQQHMDQDSSRSKRQRDEEENDGEREGLEEAWKKQVDRLETLQNDIVESILSKIDPKGQDRHKRGVLCLATALGKTRIARRVLAGIVEKGWVSSIESSRLRVLFLVHKTFVIDQACEEFRECGYLRNVGFQEHHFKKLGSHDISAFQKQEASNLNALVQFCSIQLLTTKRENQDQQITHIPKDHYDLLILDECHHNAGTRWLLPVTHFRPKCFMLGLSATPFRPSREGLCVMHYFDPKAESIKEPLSDENVESALVYRSVTVADALSPVSSLSKLVGGPLLPRPIWDLVYFPVADAGPAPVQEALVISGKKKPELDGEPEDEDDVPENAYLNENTPEYVDGMLVYKRPSAKVILQEYKKMVETRHPDLFVRENGSPKTIIFCRRKNMANVVARYFTDQGHPACAIHSGFNDAQNARRMERFRLPMNNSIILPVDEDPLQLSSGDSSVTVRCKKHSLVDGDKILLSGSPDVNGIPCGQLNRVHSVHDVNPTSFKITVESKANATGLGGGESVRLSVGEVRIAVVDGMFDEGVSVPSVSVIIFASPTTSATKFLQQLGRVLRVNKENPKKKPVVLDIVCNILRPWDDQKPLPGEGGDGRAPRPIRGDDDEDEKDAGTSKCRILGAGDVTHCLIDKISDVFKVESWEMGGGTALLRAPRRSPSSQASSMELLGNVVRKSGDASRVDNQADFSGAQQLPEIAQHKGEKSHVSKASIPQISDGLAKLMQSLCDMPSPNSKVPSGKTSESSGKKPDKERLRDEAKMMKNGLVADCVVLVFLRLIVLRVWEDNGRFHYGKKNICETIFEVWEGEGGLVTGSDGGEQALLQSQEPLFGLASSSSDSVIGDIDAVDDGEAMSFSEEGDGLCNSEETVKVLKKIFHVAASYSPVLDENFAEVYVSGFFYHPLFTDTERSYAHQLKTRLTEMRSSGISHPSAYETATPLDDPRVALHILGYLSRYDFHGADATTMMRLSLVQFQQAIRVGSNKTNEGVSNDLCELLVSSIPNLSPESAILDIWCDKGQIFSGLGSRVDPRSYVGIDPCLTNVLAAECSVLLNSTNRAPKSIREEVLAFKFLTQNCLSLMNQDLEIAEIQSMAESSGARDPELFSEVIFGDKFDFVVGVPPSCSHQGMDSRKKFVLEPLCNSELMWNDYWKVFPWKPDRFSFEFFMWLALDKCKANGVVVLLTPQDWLKEEVVVDHLLRFSQIQLLHFVPNSSIVCVRLKKRGQDTFCSANRVECRFPDEPSEELLVQSGRDLISWEKLRTFLGNQAQVMDETLEEGPLISKQWCFVAPALEDFFDVMKYFPSVMGNESISSRPRVYWLYQLLECWKGVNGRNLETPRTWRTFGYGYAEYACPDMIIHDFMFNGHWVAQTVLSFFFSLEFGTRDIAFLASLELLSGSEKTYLSLDLLEQKLLSTEFFNDGAMCAILPATTLLHYKLMKLVFERFGLLVEFVVNTEDAGPVKNQVCIRQGIFQGSVRTMLMLPDFQVFDPCSDVGDGRGRFTQHDHLQLESVILMRVSKPEAPIFSPYPTTLNAKAVVQSGVENFENDVMVFRLAKEQASGVKKIK